MPELLLGLGLFFASSVYATPAENFLHDIRPFTAQDPHLIIDTCTIQEADSVTVEVNTRDFASLGSAIVASRPSDQFGLFIPVAQAALRDSPRKFVSSVGFKILDESYIERPGWGDFYRIRTYKLKVLVIENNYQPLDFDTLSEGGPFGLRHLNYRILSRDQVQQMNEHVLEELKKGRTLHFECPIKLNIF